MDGVARRGLAPLVAASAGLALLASHPPVGAWWATFLAPALLLGAIELRPDRSALLGAVAGVVFFGPLLTWLLEPAGALAWALLVLIMAAYLAALAALVRPWLTSPLLPAITAVAWLGMDAWRAVFPLGGFEWAAIPYAHVDGSFLLPVARILGGRGITLLVVLVGAAAYVAVRNTVRAVRDREGGPMEDALGATRLPLGLLLGGLLVSVLLTVEPPPERGELDVLAVQGQAFQWSEAPPNASLHITETLRDLTREAVATGPAPDLVVWPEAAVERDPDSDRGARYAVPLAEGAAAAGRLLAGVNLDGPSPDEQFFRSALLYDDQARPLDRYDKRQLVPFGEYVPWRGLLGWFPPLQQVPRDAIAQAGPSVIGLEDGTDLAVLICFETMFEGITRSNLLASDGDPAQLVLALTTDASFGDSAEPAQHLAQSRLRAVETGRWVVHAALSGASAFVDPQGQAHQTTALFTADTIRRAVPLVEGRTPFLVTGDLLGPLGRLAAVVLAASAVHGWWRERRRELPTADGEEALVSASGPR